ncbi:hypothetical protein C5C36_13730 [Rathayibacter sp. AY1G1]|uniref:hypothetical protein n=1 Tax=unclassified Rathayibacter TaxID=2609250 RepID=UPI000CE81CE0|nr:MULTISPECIES: hypothetical protein [unclassified Rathayibacter]PPG50947.1 hypothetical protein C5C41_12600 [Rathayibacter sp. AY1E9]PPH04017.1 hypothetical protein C5C71_17080 [Rathayibacter sp. AY1C1]PPH10625.1 hypothetical protein C5C36_13730 [Rathayibacter sp. AY1G1]PPH35591.1 hypothetical protein C5C86_16700 [Rathayibacter sp. AY1E4]
MSARSSAAVRRSTGAALRWCRFYTRGLDPHFAVERADEIASDLFEHTRWAQEAEQVPARTAHQIRSRTLRGVGSDLLWRRARLHEGSADVLFNARVGSLSTALWAVVFVLVLASVVFGGWASIRLATESPMPFDTVAPVYAATAAAALALLLLLHHRTRSAGAVLGAVAVSVLPTIAVDALWYVSATVPVLVSSVSSLDLVLLLLGNAQGLVLLATVLCWSIARRPTESQVTL